MSKIKLKCVEADCDWVSEEAEFDVVKYYMDTFIELQHAPVQPTMQTTSATLPESRPQAERVKRPSLTFLGSTLEVEEFEHFKHLFDLYKSRLGGNQNNATLLLECLATDVSRAVFSSYGTSMTSMSEEELMDAISTCRVTKQTLQA